MPSIVPSLLPEILREVHPAAFPRALRARSRRLDAGAPLVKVLVTATFEHAAESSDGDQPRWHHDDEQGQAPAKPSEEVAARSRVSAKCSRNRREYTSG